MKFITVDESNIDNGHICCAIGNDKENQLRTNTKKSWMKRAFEDGLVFRKLDERGKVFIEYMPVEKCWKPVSGKNYMIINCLWVSGKYKGLGLSKELLQFCIDDALKLNKNGILAIASKKTMPFMTDKKFYEKMGFVSIDTAEPYFELMLLKLKDDTESASFMPGVKTGIGGNKVGFTLIYSNQCPFMEAYVEKFGEILKKMNCKYEIVKLNNYREAQEKGSPFGTLGIYYNGKFVSHELVPERKMEEFLKKCIE